MFKLRFNKVIDGFAKHEDKGVTSHKLQLDGLDT